MLSGLSGTQRYALFVLLVVVVVVIYLVVSGGLEDFIGGDDDQQAVQQLSQEQALIPDAVLLGESARVGAIEVAIQHITFPNQIRAEGLWRSPAERFAAVQLTMTNRSNQAVELPLNGLQLVTVDGRAYLADAALSLGASRVAEVTAYAPPLILQPQLTITVVAVYDIPIDASGLQLRVQGGYTDFALFE